MRPRIVYLDQADWAYLHAGRAPEADKVLRNIGANGTTVFLITVHHFEESSSLDNPWERIEFIRDFPGTALTECSGYDVLRFEAEKLAHIPAPEIRPRIDMFPLVDIPDGDLKKLTYGLKHSHSSRKLLEPLHAQRRELFHLDQLALKACRATSSRADNLNLWRAQIRGQPEEAISLWERIMGVQMDDMQRNWMRRKTELSSTGWRLAECAFLVPPADLDFDNTFASIVFTIFSEDTKRDRQAVVRALKAWNCESRPVSPLSCSAAVAAAVIDNPARGYAASEQIDILHAAFACIVDVFTADKRTIDALCRLNLKGHMLRTNKLSEVAALLSGGES